MVTGAPESPLWGCCAPGGPPPTPLPIRSRCSTPRWPSCPNRCGARVLVRGDSGSGVQPLLWHVHRPGVGLLGGFLGRQPVQDALAALPKQAWRAALRSRRPPPRRRPSRRADPVDAGHLDRVAARDAHHRPPRTSPSRRPVAHHRRRRLAHHRVRHQHRRGPHRRSGGAPPAACPRRRPHPWTQGHRDDQPALAGVRQEPDLARISLSGLRIAHLDPTAGLPRPARPNLGTQTPATAVAGRGRAA